MKSALKACALFGIVITACSVIVSCKTTAATHKHEFKKELHKVERAH